MSQRSSMLANLLGRGASLFLNLATLPLYLELAGPEAVGLIGLNIIVFSLFSLLDLGLPTTLNRNLAALSAKGMRKAMATNLRTFEYVFWSVSLVILMVGYTVADYLSLKWLKSIDLERDVVFLSMAFLMISAAVRFSISLYQAALYGLNSQVQVNLIIVVSALLRLVLPLIWIYLYEGGIVVFFIVQAGVYFLELCYSAAKVWSIVGWSQTRSKFDKNTLLRSFNFSLGVTGISVTAAILSQVDRVVLSNVLSLTEFGYYSIAISVSSGLISIAYPLANAAFPHLTGYLATKDIEGARSSFLFFFRVLIALIFPIVVTMVFFSKEIMELYVSESAKFVWPLTRVMVVGAFFSCLTALPHVFLLAKGNWRPALMINCACTPLYIIAILIASEHGALTVAYCYSIYHLVYFLALSLLAIEKHNEIFGNLMFPELRKLAYPFLICAGVAFLIDQIGLYQYGETGAFGLILLFFSFNLVLLPLLKKDYRCLLKSLLSRSHRT